MENDALWGWMKTLIGYVRSGRPDLTNRQMALLQNALKNPGQIYTVKSHMNSHRVARQTARTDLTALAVKFGLLVEGVEGRATVFTAPGDLLERIKSNC